VILTYRSHADEAEAVLASNGELGRSALALQLDTGVIESSDAFVGAVTDARRRASSRPESGAARALPPPHRCAALADETHATRVLPLRHHRADGSIG
jgi:hypothetical protein